MVAEWLSLHFNLLETLLEEFPHPFSLSTQGVGVAYRNITPVFLPLCPLWAAAVFVLSVGHLKDT